MTRHRAVLTLAALTALLFADVLFRGRVFYERDIFQLVYSQAETFVRCVAAGSWPLWDPWVGFGQPMLANPGAQVLYPWTWLNLVFLPETSFTIYVTSHLFLSALGLFLLSRRLGFTTGAALAAAAVWMLSGPLLSLVSLWQHFAGAAWIPWVLLAADRAMASPGPVRAFWWGLAMGGQILAGSVEMCATAALLQLGAALRHLRTREAWRRSGPRIAAAGAAAAALAVALTAALWLPALDVLRASSRSELAEGTRTYWSLHPANLLQALLPVFPHRLPLRPDVRTVLFEGREPFLGSVYLGLGTLPLVAASFAGRRWRLAAALAAAGGGAALMALGKFGLAYPLATALLPPLTIFRYPSKAILVTALAWSLLAGLGYETWREPTPAAARKRVILALVIAAALTALPAGAVALARARAQDWAPSVLLPDPSGRSLSAVLDPPSRGLLLTGGLAAAVLALLVARVLSARFAAALAAAAVVLAVADLLVVHRSLNPTAPRELIFRRPAVVSVLRHEGPTRIYVFDYFLHVLGKAPRPRAPTPAAAPELAAIPGALVSTLMTQDFLSSPVGQRWGFYGSYDYDWLLLLPRPRRNLSLFLRAVEDTPGLVRLLRIGGVSYVVSLHTDGLEGLVPVATVDSSAAGPVHVFAVPSPLPRAYVVDAARVVDGFPALRTLVDPAFDPAREVLLAEGAGRDPDPAFSGETRLLDYRPDRVRVEARLEGAGFLVLLDGHDSGWRATVDGRAADVLRANVGFRAVPVPAGTHVVEMRYRPRSAMAGLLVSALAVTAVAAILLRIGSRDRAEGR